MFDPLPIDLDPADLKGGEARKRADYPELVERLSLSDGAVYDNMGLEPVWKDHQTVLVSDGGATFDFAPDRGSWIGRLGRYLSVQSNQAGSVRKRWLIANFQLEEMAGTYWGIGSAVADYKSSDGYPDFLVKEDISDDGPSDGYPERLVDEVISEVRTDLDCFSEAEQAVLENHGYLLANAAVLRHLPDLADRVPPAVPHPAYLDPETVKTALASSHKRRLLGRWRGASARRRPGR